jgi:M-phase inducer tyrosine phosphatase
MRRAQSVCDQPAKMDMSMSEEESEFEASPSVEYARRNGSRVVPRVDGSPGFKPMRSSLAITSEVSASPSKGKKTSPYGSGGLPGFGDNEMDGKILPCHKVKEDGLVRVAPSTVSELVSLCASKLTVQVSDLLAGKYDDKIKRYHIIDCRFEYEYEGGHIENAIHVKEMGTLDSLLLSASSGVHAGGNPLPRPSRSGELGVGEQVVLIFHCEFSAKRAPTL